MMGNLTRDPELRETPTGRKVVELGLAMNDRFKNKAGEWTERPIYVDVSAWDRQAETCAQYLKKGSPVLVDGSLRYDTWESEGRKRSKLSVTANRVVFLGSPRQDQLGAGPAAAPPAAAAPAPTPAAAPAPPPNTQPAPPPPPASGDGGKVPGYSEDEGNDDLPF